MLEGLPLEGVVDFICEVCIGTILVVPKHKAGCPSLDTFYLVDVSGCVRIPGWGGIVEVRSDEGLVGCFFSLLAAHMEVPSAKVEEISGFFGDGVYVFIEGEFIVEDDAKVSV